MMLSGEGDGLRDKVAIVTGGSRGLGLEIARAFAREGADLVVASRKQENCDAIATEIAADHGVKCFGVGFHAGKWDDCDTLLAKATDLLGPVDILVNNAGMSPLYPSPSAITEDLFDKVVGVNLRGPFRLMAIAGEQMQAHGGGSMINISSVAAVRPRPIEIPYSAAKAGLNAITEAYAHAYGPTVRVNAIQAGPFLTDVADHWDMAEVQTELDRFALRRAGQPSEIAGAAIFLASDMSSYMTGAVLRLDGGHP